MNDEVRQVSKTENASSGRLEQLVMPCPRLEFRWNKSGDTWHHRECVYSLVLPLGELDIRHTDEKENPTEKFLEIGRTKVTGGNGELPIFNKKVDTPFRDYSHALWDRESLGNHLPIVCVCNDFFNLVTLPPK